MKYDFINGAEEQCHFLYKLEGYLEEAGCASTILVGIVIILLLYDDDIVLLARCPSDLDKKLRIRLLKDFCSTMGMTVNTNKTKVMIIKTNCNFNFNLNKINSGDKQIR